MAIITLDFDVDKEAAGIPAGTHKFQILEATPKIATTGSPMIELRMEVIEDPDPNVNGRAVYDNLVLVPKAAWKLKEFCVAIGIDWRVLDPDTLNGRTVWAETTINADRGRAEIDRYRASS